VVHDAVGGGEDEEAKVARGKNVRDPLLELVQLNIIPRGDDTALVDAAL
jgi:hypothetical protein